MEAKFKPGDLVKLKSGGPVMTVSTVDQGDGPDPFRNETETTYFCGWFAGKKLDGATFRETSLLSATEEDLK